MRHPLPYAFARSHQLLLEDDGQQLVLWHGPQPAPAALSEVLRKHRVQQLMALEAAPLAQRLGLRAGEGPAGVQIKTVLRGGAAEAAGFMAGDEWLGVELPGEAWRLQQLDDVLLYAGTQTQLTALLARDRRLLRVPLSLPPANIATDTVRLDVTDAQAAGRWLGPA